eukprot:gene24598-27815_t
MASTHTRIRPPDDSTTARHSTAGWRDRRQCTSMNQPMVAQKATSMAGVRNSGLKPGTSLSALCAALAGQPVSMALQNSHRVAAHRVSTMTENQSMALMAPRFMVSRPKAAMMASGGSSSSSWPCSGAGWNRATLLALLGGRVEQGQQGGHAGERDRHHDVQHAALAAPGVHGPGGERPGRPEEPHAHAQEVAQRLRRRQRDLRIVPLHPGARPAPGRPGSSCAYRAGIRAPRGRAAASAFARVGDGCGAAYA